MPWLPARASLADTCPTNNAVTCDRHISEERFAWYRAPAVAQPHRSSSSLSSLDSSRGECHTSSAAEHAGDECLGAGDQGQQRRKQLPHEHQKQQQQPQQQPQLGKPLLGKGHQGSEWSHRGDASTSAAVQHCSIAPRSRPNSRAGGGGAEASMAGPWPVKLQQPRSRLGLAELAAGGSAVARLLQAADAFGGDDDDVDNCCPTCLEAYSESEWQAGGDGAGAGGAGVVKHCGDAHPHAFRLWHAIPPPHPHPFPPRLQATRASRRSAATTSTCSASTAGWSAARTRAPSVKRTLTLTSCSRHCEVSRVATAPGHVHLAMNT